MRKIKSFRLIGFIIALAIIFSSLSVFGSTVAFAAEDSTSYSGEEFVESKEFSNAANGETLQSAFSNKTVRECEYVYNLDDSADYIYVEFENGGYALFSRETMEMMEYSLQGTLPYSNSSTKDYYAGPSNYLQKIDSKFINALTNEQLDITADEALKFAQQVRTSIKSQSSYKSNVKIENNNIVDEVKSFLNSNINTVNDEDSKPKIDTDSLIYPTVGTGTLIPNYRYFIVEPTHGDNYTGETYGNGNSGTCGSVAAQILLGYNNYYNDRRIIEDRFLNGYNDSSNTVSIPERNPNHCTDPMSMTSWTTGTRSEDTGTNSFYSKVVTTIMKPNTSGASVKEVYNGIKSILNENLSSSDYSIDYELKGWFFGYSPVSSTPIKAEIDAGRPLIISLSSNLGATNHQVVGYGYQNYTYPDGSGTYEGYIVHFGWQGETCVWVNSSWCKGYISLEMNHEHSYYTVGTISGTSRTEYKCSTCGHRTDAAINMTAMDRYVERVATIPQNGYVYKDYYVKFATAGKKMFQTFGSKDAKLYLFDTKNNQLAYNDDAGYGFNSMFYYTVEANKPYILRVKFYSDSTTGDVKVGITPASVEYSTFEDIWTHESAGGVTFIFSSSLNTTRVITFTPTESGTYTFKTGYEDETRVDTYLYVVDPYTTNSCLYNDDGAGDLQALITMDLVAGRTYFMVVSTYNITSTTGRLSVSVNKTS